MCFTKLTSGTQNRAGKGTWLAFQSNCMRAQTHHCASLLPFLWVAKRKKSSIHNSSQVHFFEYSSLTRKEALFQRFPLQVTQTWTTQNISHHWKEFVQNECSGNAAFCNLTQHSHSQHVHQVSKWQHLPLCSQSQHHPSYPACKILSVLHRTQSNHSISRVLMEQMFVRWQSFVGPIYLTSSTRNFNVWHWGLLISYRTDSRLFCIRMPM